MEDMYGESLTIGDKVVFEVRNHQLAKGIVVAVGLPDFPEAILVGSVLRQHGRSLATASRCVKM